MLKRIILLLTLSIPCITLWSQTDCKELVEYRDNELFVTFDEVFDDYCFDSDKVENFKQYKKQLEDNNWFIMSGNGEITLAIAGVLSTLSDLILDLMPPIPAETGKELVIEAIMESIEIQQNVQSVVESGIVYTVTREAASKLNPITKLANAFYGLYENTSGTLSNLDEAEKTKKNMLEILDSLERDIDKYEKEVKEADEVIVLINMVKNTIDEHCNE